MHMVSHCSSKVFSCGITLKTMSNICQTFYFPYVCISFSITPWLKFDKTAKHPAHAQQFGHCLCRWIVLCVPNASTADLQRSISTCLGASTLTKANPQAVHLMDRSYSSWKTGASLQKTSDLGLWQKCSVHIFAGYKPQKWERIVEQCSPTGLGNEIAKLTLRNDPTSEKH